MDSTFTRVQIRIIVFFFLTALAAGCSLVGDPLLDQIGRAEQTWQARKVLNYRVSVLHVQSIWHAQTYTLTVKNGVVVDQSATCIPAPFEGRNCTVRSFKADDYTVTGLFATVRTMAQGESRKGLTVTFDETYGFPKTIKSAPPGVVDGDSSWSVQKFELLE